MNWMAIAEWRGGRGTPNTTWPWNIKLSLMVLWGVCWMFFPPFDLNEPIEEANWADANNFVWNFDDLDTPDGIPNILNDVRGPYPNQSPAASPYVNSFSGNDLSAINRIDTPGWPPFLEASTAVDPGIFLLNNEGTQASTITRQTDAILHTIDPVNSQAPPPNLQYSTAVGPVSGLLNNQETQAWTARAITEVASENNAGTDATEFDRSTSIPTEISTKDLVSTFISLPLNAVNQFYCDHAECTTLQLTFDRRCDWKRHMDKHTRPYKCHATGCEDLPGFTYPGGLTRHQGESHSEQGGSQPVFACPHDDCKRSSNGPGAKFTRKWNLEEHLRRVHKNAPPAMTDGSAQQYMAGPVQPPQAPSIPAETQGVAPPPASSTASGKRRREPSDEGDGFAAKANVFSEEVKRLRRIIDGKDAQLAEKDVEIKVLKDMLRTAYSSQRSD